MAFKTYQSHKIVEADKIVKWENKGDHYLLTSEDGTQYREIPALFARGEPQDGYFYLVKYDNGYKSWSPKDAFENGYNAVNKNKSIAKN